jgi:hypothetical protein
MSAVNQPCLLLSVGPLSSDADIGLLSSDTDIGLLFSDANVEEEGFSSEELARGD